MAGHNITVGQFQSGQGTQCRRLSFCPDAKVSQSLVQACLGESRNPISVLDRELGETMQTQNLDAKFPLSHTAF